MNKELFDLLLKSCSKDCKLGIVLNTIEGCGGYSTSQSVLKVTKNHILLHLEYAEIVVEDINKQYAFGNYKVSGNFLIPYSEIKMVIKDYCEYFKG